jgi:protein-tyrosine phosphatase
MRGEQQFLVFRAYTGMDDGSDPVAWANQMLRSRTHPLRLEVGQEIVPGVFLGGIDCSKNISFLEEHDIRYVLTLGARMPARFPDRAEYLVLDKIADDPDQDLLRVLPQCVAFVAKARRNNGAVLVHCFAGVSRSATIVIAYLMAASAAVLTVPEALAIVKRRRPFVDPNPGFLTQLKKWELHCSERRADRASPSWRAALLFAWRRPHEAVDMVQAQPLLLGTVALTMAVLFLAVCTIVLP